MSKNDSIRQISWQNLTNRLLPRSLMMRDNKAAKASIKIDRESKLRYTSDDRGDCVKECAERGFIKIRWPIFLPNLYHLQSHSFLRLYTGFVFLPWDIGPSLGPSSIPQYLLIIQIPLKLRKPCSVSEKLF